MSKTEAWIIRDNHENPWGPFDSSDAATDWAKCKWPAAPNDGGGYWQIERLRTPTGQIAGVAR